MLVKVKSVQNKINTDSVCFIDNVDLTVSTSVRMNSRTMISNDNPHAEAASRNGSDRSMIAIDPRKSGSPSSSCSGEVPRKDSSMLQTCQLGAIELLL